MSEKTMKKTSVKELKPTGARTAARSGGAQRSAKIKVRSPRSPVSMVAIKDIVIPPHRKPDPAIVRQLVASIAEVDLLNPIILTPEVELVAGRNRIAAFVELGKTHILARTATWGMLERELAEIDENIVRRRFSVLERGRLLARKKELYEALHPEARQHARGGHAKAATEAATETISVAPAFASDAADKLGTSERSVREEIRIAIDLAPQAAKILSGTPLEDEKVLLMQLTRLPREQQVPVARLLVDGRTKSVKSAIAVLEGGAGETEKKNLRRRKGRDITARVREVTNSLHEAGKRLARLLDDLDPALVQGAQQISIALKELEERTGALAPSGAEPAAEPSNRGHSQTCRDEHAPTMTVGDLSRRIRDAKSRFSKRHGGLLDGSSTFADYMKAHRGDPESVRAAMDLLASDLATFVREANSFSVPGWMREPMMRKVHVAGCEASPPTGPKRSIPPSGSPFTPLPPVSTTSASAPSKAMTHNPTGEEVEAVVVQIIEDYKSGALYRPFQGQAKIWQKNWPAHVKEAAREKFFAMFDALPASVRAATRSGSSAGTPPAVPAGAGPSRLGTRTTTQESIPARLEASASRDPSTPGMGEFERAAMLARVAPAHQNALARAARLAWADTG